jgi:hypothetical protein
MSRTQPFCLGITLLLAGCTGFDGVEVCRIASEFTLGAGTATTYVDVAPLTNRLSRDLKNAAGPMRDSALKEEAQYAAFVADLTTQFILSGQPPATIQEEIDLLVDIVLRIRSLCR